jgi:uncharacterized protein DUF11/Big-like domain-containing protein
MKRKSITLRSIVILSLILTAQVVATNAQQNRDKNAPVPPPRIDILRLEGSKPNLKPDGEGLTSYLAYHLYKSGQTRVKAYDLNVDIELPTGYTLFNNLAYRVDTEVVFSGPNQITFQVPSASTAESFNQLRILCAEANPAEPEKLNWGDITVTSAVPEDQLHRGFSKPALLPNFATRTLNAVTDAPVLVLVVASRDEKLARDNFTADLQLKIDVSADSVMEGRELDYSFSITNHGPDSATRIFFSSQIGPEYVSLNSTQGKCRFGAANIYCNLGELKKGETATINYRGRCRWDFVFDGRPVESNGMYVDSSVYSAEIDSNPYSNYVSLSTPVKEDPNRKPVISIVEPKRDTFLVGPKVDLNLVANAHDPDGTISKVEFYDERGLIGLGKLTALNTYEISYQTETIGTHIVRAFATDNQGRPSLSDQVHFIVNGSIQIQITDPKPGQFFKLTLDEFVVRVRATNPKGQIKEVRVFVSEGSGSSLQRPAQLVSNGEYIATFEDLGWACSYGPCFVWVIATDDSDVQTMSKQIDFRVGPP